MGSVLVHQSFCLLKDHIRVLSSDSELHFRNKLIKLDCSTSLICHFYLLRYIFNLSKLDF